MAEAGLFGDAHNPTQTCTRHFLSSLQVNSTDTACSEASSKQKKILWNQGRPFHGNVCAPASIEYNPILLFISDPKANITVTHFFFASRDYLSPCSHGRVDVDDDDY